MNTNPLIQELIEALTMATGGTTTSDSGFVTAPENQNQTKFIFVSREHAGDSCWYTLNDAGKPEPCPTTALRGKLETIYQIDTQRGGKGQYKSTKMRLGIRAGGTLYVIENGAETVFSQSIAAAILHGNIALGDTILLQVSPADQNEKVVFSQVYDSENSKIIPPKNSNRTGAVLKAQQKLGCQPPEKKDSGTATPPARTASAPAKPQMIEPDLPDYDDIDF